MAMLPSAVAQDSQKEAPVTLSPFTVSSLRDFGYQATNSITATRIGTPIKDTPINITVLTSDMLKDTGDLDMSQLVNRVSSVNTTNREDDKNDKNDVTIRGFPIIVLQNGYEKFFSYPTDFVERVEIIKGPNSIFFGRVSPGGAVNFITKKPLFESSSSLAVTYGSYDFKKAALDLTGPIGEKLAYRVFGSFRDNGNWIDYTAKDESTLAAALTWQPTKSTVLDLNYTYNLAHSGYLHSAPRGHPLYNLPSVNPAVPINSFVPALVGPNAPWATNYIYDLTYGSKGKKGNYSGPDNYSDREANQVDGMLSWELNAHVSFRHAANYSDYWGERLILGGFPAADGSVRQSGIRERFSGAAHEVTNDALLSFDAAGMEHRLLAGHTYRKLESRTYTASRATVPAFQPRTDPPIALGRLVPALAGTYGLIDDETQAFYVSDQVSVADGRFRFLLGARRTNVVSHTGTQAGLVASTRQETTRTTFQGGLVLRVAKDLNLYANYSESFQPQPNLDVNGVRAEPTEGTGFEFGLKSDWLGGRLSGSLAVYQVERAKIARRNFARELAEGRSPYFITGGLERSEGLELDLTYAPTRNYQVVFSYGYMWEARTVADPQTPGQVNRRIFNTPEHVVNLWNRYTFLGGPAKGLTVGGGLRYSSEHNAHPLFQIGIVNDAYFIVDAFASYPAKIFGREVEYSLSVKNLLDNDDYYPGSYIPGDPLKAYLTARLKF